MSEARSFFVGDGDHFVATELTRGPWDAHYQHAGPPSALLVRAIEALPGGIDKRLVRITIEMMGPIPIASVKLEASVIKPGRKTDLVEARLVVDGDVTLMLARAWRYRHSEVDLPQDIPLGPRLGATPALPPAGDNSEMEFFSVGPVGYHTAMEWRFAAGSLAQPGDAVAWMRMRVPLLPNEEPSPTQRVLSAVDAASGISARLDPTRFLFVNTDLTVLLHREPAGEWVCLDASTTLEPRGIGVCSSTISDAGGVLGRSLQTLFVANR